MFHWIFWAAGLSSPNDPPYLFWSGIGADALRLLLVGGLARVAHLSVRHHRESTAMHERHNEARRESE